MPQCSTMTRYTGRAYAGGGGRTVHGRDRDCLAEDAGRRQVVEALKHLGAQTGAQKGTSVRGLL
jgi:hypothetical protein